MTLRACLICGTPFQPTKGNTSRCDQHQLRKRPRGRPHRRAAAALIAASDGICAICGEPFTAADPPVCDHITPLAYGGSDHPTNLQATHRSCNGRKSATLPGP
jgi:5-methylcytosine-specific restriction endonuclease McrA